MQISEIIKWTKLSEYLTGNSDRIRENRIPKKHKLKVKLLIYFLKMWDNLINDFDINEK